MAITLGSITLPQGCRWSDEFDWSPVAQAVGYTLTGAVVVQEATKLKGRPITLVGGASFAWMTRTNLLALQTALAAPGATFILTLHDARAFTVMPRRDGDGPLKAYQRAAIQDSGLANPSGSTWYIIDEIRLMEV